MGCRSVVTDHGVQGEDALVGGGDDSLVVAFALGDCAVVVGRGDGSEHRDAKAGRYIARLRRLLSAWQTYSPRMEDPERLVTGVRPA